MSPSRPRATYTLPDVPHAAPRVPILVQLPRRRPQLLLYSSISLYLSFLLTQIKVADTI